MIHLSTALILLLSKSTRRWPDQLTQYFSFSSDGMVNAISQIPPLAEFVPLIGRINPDFIFSTASDGMPEQILSLLKVSLLGIRVSILISISEHW